MQLLAAVMLQHRKNSEEACMQRIIFATGNENKMKEIRAILQGLHFGGEPVEIVSMKEAGIVIEIEETGTSFEENAQMKAQAVWNCAGGAIVMADDSGLEIDYLNKEPGIYSARYMGEDTSYHIKNLNLLERLQGVPEEKRAARFVCAIACVMPDGKCLVTRETIEGRIGYEEKGNHGFGYDPIFYVPEYGKSTAELSEDEKNEISHRGKALRSMRQRLENYQAGENI